MSVSPEDFNATIGALRSELQAAESRYVNMVQEMRGEMVKLQATLGAKDAKLQEMLAATGKHTKSRDLFITKKGFVALPTFNGKAEKYNDW